MSFAIPSLAALTDRVRRAFRANLPGTDAWVWPNNVTPTAKVIAGATFEIYGRLDYVQRQKFAITADPANLVSEAWQSTAIPTVYVVDKKGIIRNAIVGLDPPELRRAEAQIEKLAAE